MLIDSTILAAIEAALAEGYTVTFRKDEGGDYVLAPGLNFLVLGGVFYGSFVNKDGKLVEARVPSSSAAVYFTATAAA